jgi:NADH:ubiquinone oxidoreductase subunit 3 (subunit A)
MNQIRRILGLIWMALGPVAIYFMIAQALMKVGDANTKINAAINEAAKAAAEAAKLNVQMQWGIIILIFVPIAFGLVIFGYYSVKGEYDRA